MTTIVPGRMYPILCAGFLLTLSSCIFIKPVTVTGISNFKTVHPLTDPEFRFDLGLKNPNNFGVTLQKLEIGLAVDEPVLARVTMLEGTRITRKESVLVAVALKPSMNEISGLFKSGVEGLFGQGAPKPLQVKGEIVVGKFIFRKKYKIKEVVKW